MKKCAVCEHGGIIWYRVRHHLATRQRVMEGEGGSAPDRCTRGDLKKVKQSVERRRQELLSTSHSKRVQARILALYRRRLRQRYALKRRLGWVQQPLKYDPSGRPIRPSGGSIMPYVLAMKKWMDEEKLRNRDKDEELRVLQEKVKMGDALHKMRKKSVEELQAKLDDPGTSDMVRAAIAEVLPDKIDTEEHRQSMEEMSRNRRDMMPRTLLPCKNPRGVCNPWRRTVCMNPLRLEVVESLGARPKYYASTKSYSNVLNEDMLCPRCAADPTPNDPPIVCQSGFVYGSQHLTPEQMQELGLDPSDCVP